MISGRFQRGVRQGMLYMGRRSIGIPGTCRYIAFVTVPASSAPTEERAGFLSVAHAPHPVCTAALICPAEGRGVGGKEGQGECRGPSQGSEERCRGRGESRLCGTRRARAGAGCFVVALQAHAWSLPFARISRGIPQIPIGDPSGGAKRAGGIQGTVSGMRRRVE